MVRQNALKIRSWVDVFWVLYYDHVNITTSNTQLLYMLLCSYWLSRFDIPKIFLQHGNNSISLELR